MPANGVNDLDQYLFEFYGAVQLKGWSMLIWRFMLSQTLRGASRVWFDDLPGGCINTFEAFRSILLK